MAEELLPAFQFADSRPFQSGLSFGHTKNGYSIDLCKRKSFWKKFKKWCSEVTDWIDTALKLLKSVNEAKDAYEQWQKKNQNNNANYQ